MISTRKKVISVLSIAVSFCLLIWIISRPDYEELSQTFRNMDWRWTACALAITCAIPFFSTLRWRSILKSQNIQLPFLVTLRAVMIGNVLNSFLPSKSGDFVKAAYLREHTGWVGGAGTVILERLVDLFVIGAIALPFSFLIGNMWSVLVGSLLVFGVIFGLFAVSIIPTFEKWLPKKIFSLAMELRAGFRSWIVSPVLVIRTLFFSACVWSSAGLTIGFLSKAFFTGVAFETAFSIFPICVLAGLVPITVSGIGTRDAVMVELFMNFGASLESASAVAIGYTSCAYWLLSFISIPFVFVQVIKSLKGKS